MSVNIIVAGVGGQGSILASHIIAEAAILAEEESKVKGAGKLNVRVGETFGAAMRGGAVASHVRIGEDVYGPLVGKGQADLILALEPLEGLRIGTEYIKDKGIAVLNSESLPPVDVKIGASDYPKIDAIRKALQDLGGSVSVIDATQLAIKAGTAKAMNIVMLGAVTQSGVLPFSEEVMLEAVKRRVPQKFLEANITAFSLGKEAYEGCKSDNYKVKAGDLL
jgi:indolepyruvate ferredoxin oxidoreductase beta subunit